MPSHRGRLLHPPLQLPGPPDRPEVRLRNVRALRRWRVPQGNPLDPPPLFHLQQS
jgi:hypothetical protein